MRVIVPDASVLLKWVLRSPDEQDREAALKLREAAARQEVQLKVPSLWLYEVGNALTIQVPKEANSLMQALLSYRLDESSWTSDWLHTAISLTQKYKVSFYDASYHALAIVERGTFVTADLQYVKKAKAEGAVISLRDLV